MSENLKPILDACCGGRMFWFDKQNPAVIFMDNRTLDDTLCDGRSLQVKPDVVGDFRNMPFDDETFRLVVFDPPHLLHAGDDSWLAKKYGVLDESTWREDIRQGFSECMRALKPYGTLIFKWNEGQVDFRRLKRLFPCPPLFGQRRAKTFWIVFMKLDEK